MLSKTLKTYTTIGDINLSKNYNLRMGLGHAMAPYIIR